jgi:hypothetical protein
MQYDEVKRVLLHEFKLSSSALHDRFNGVSSQANETLTLYGQRLKSTLSYFVERRKAERHYLLMELLAGDRIKSQLSNGALHHILSIEIKPLMVGFTSINWWSLLIVSTRLILLLKG